MNKVYAIEQECDDPYYGYFVFELFESREDAQARLDELIKAETGDYRLNEWPVEQNSLWRHA